MSVVLHGLGAWALFGLWTPAESPGNEAAERTPTPLGIERSEATTITWIGFEEPTPHEAKVASVDQAPQELGGSPASRALAREARRLAERAREESRRTLSAIERALREIDLRVDPKPEPKSEPTPETAARPETPVDPSPEPETPGRPAQPAPEPGNAEREADAFAIEKPVEIEWGRPIAGEGLEVLTTRRGPILSDWTSVFARPKPLGVEIVFEKSGRVVEVRKTASTGVADVDRPYIDNIYRWRARGERLERLAEGGSLTVSMRIVIK